MGPIHHVTSSLTGRARVRRGLFGRQVLQVEVCSTGYSETPAFPYWQGSYGRTPAVTWTEWRDAKPKDLQHSPRLVIGSL